MKNSKRILGVALALIMIFNVFAIGTFAAFPDDTAVKLMVKTDKATYAPGETVTITFSEQVIAEIGTMMIGGQYDIKFPTGSLEPISTATDKLATNHGFVAIQDGYDDGYSNFVNPGYDVEAGYSSIALSIMDNGTTFDATEPVDLFSFQMKVPETCADGTYTIAFNGAAYENYQGFSNDGLGMGGLYGVDASAFGFSVPNMYEFGTCTFTVGEAAPAVVVAHEGTQSKWAKGNPVIADYLFGFVGSFTGLEVETESVNGRNEVTNIASIVAAATVNGGEVKYSTVNTIWKSGDKYMFRAAFAGFDPTGDDVVSVEFTVTMKDGKTFTTEAASVKAVADIYAASVAANPGLKPLA